MTVVPGSSILSGIEDVCKLMAWSDGTLRDCIDTIHKASVQHSKAMPMDCSAVARLINRIRFISIQQIVDGNLNLISPASVKPRSRKAVVE